MRCLYCGNRLSLLRKLADGEFCSSEHRESFQQQQSDQALERLIESQRRVEGPADRRKAKPKPAAKPRGAKEEAVPEAGYLPMTASPVVVEALFTPAFEPLTREQALCLPVDPSRMTPRGFEKGGPHAWLAIRPRGNVASSASPLIVISGAVLPRLQSESCGMRGMPVPRLLQLPENEAVRSELLLALSVDWQRCELWQPLLPMVRLLAVPPDRHATLETTEQAPPLAGVVHFGSNAVDRSIVLQMQARWLNGIGRGHIPGSKLIPRRPELEQTWEPDELSGMVALRMAWTQLLRRPMVYRPMGTEAQCAFETAYAPGLPFGTYAPSRELRPFPARRVFALAPPAAFEPGLSEVGGFGALTVDGRTVLPGTVSVLDMRRELGSASGFQLESPAAIRARLTLKVRTPKALVCRQAPALPALPALQGAAARSFEPGPADGLMALPFSGTPETSSGERTYRVSQVQPMEQGEMAASVIEFRPFAGLVLDSRLLDSILTRVEEPQPETDQKVPGIRQQQFPILMLRVPPSEGPVRGSVEQKPLWDAMIARAPRQPRARLTVDRPDGSGPAPINLETPASRWRINVGPLRSATRFWRYAPADLKWIGLTLPLVLAMVLYSTLGGGTKPAVHSKTAGAVLSQQGGELKSTVGGYFANVKQNIGNRAAVNLTDDFRSGLGSWQGDGEWAKSWNYTQSSFIEPGQLAVFTPTMSMTDYSLEFLAQIDKHSVNWVFRASDTKNYQAMRLMITKPGPLPSVALVRYTVVDGKEGPKTTLPLPLQIRGDTVYRVRMEVRGDEFVTFIQDQMADHFSDDRLPRGGVGFFSPKGDKAYLRWVDVSYQYDFLGRLCAMLSPYSVPSEGRSAE
jgi:hypothetical protein